MAVSFKPLFVVKFVFIIGRIRGGICGLLTGRNGLIVEVVVVSRRSSVCQGRF